MKRRVIRNSTMLKTYPNGLDIRNLLRNEVVIPTGESHQSKGKQWIEVTVQHGPALTGYVLKEDTEEISKKGGF